MARIDIKSAGGGGSGSGTVTSVAVSSTTLTVTGSPITTSGTIVANIPDGYLKVGTGVTSSLQNVVDTNGTATTLFLSSTAAQFTSPLRITTSDASGFYLDAEDSATNNRFSIKRDPSAQEVTLDFASNPAGSTTLVGAIRTYRDGVNLSNAMSFIEDGSVGIGTNAPSQQLHVNGSLRIETGGIYDGTNSIGTSGQVLSSTGTATAWITPATTSPAGTTGAVQFNNAGAFGADSSNFFWDDTNNRLGIGTATPTGTLQVKGSGTTSATTSLLVQNSAGTEVLKVTDDSVTNARGSLNVLHPSVVTRSLKLGWGSIFATDSGSELTIGAVFTVPSAPQILLAGNTRGSGPNTIQLQASAGVSIATSLINPSAQLHIKGSGSTSATTSLLVQNSAGFAAITVTDDLKVNINTLVFGGSNGYIGINNSPNIDSALRSVRTDGGTSPLSISTGEVGVGDTTTYPSAIFAIGSTTRGFLPPRMTTAEKNAIATPAAGLMVYDTTLNKLCVYTTAWETITSV